MPVSTTSAITVDCDLCGASATAEEFPKDWWGAAVGREGHFLVTLKTNVATSFVQLVICPACIQPLLEQASKRKTGQAA